MATVRRVLLVAVVIGLAGACFAQAGPPPGAPGGGQGGGRGGRGGGLGFMGRGLVQSVLEDVMLLNRLVTLQLTDLQLGAILEAYTKYPATTDERLAKLLEMRGRVVAGAALTAADMEAIRGMVQRQQGNQPQPQPQASSPLGEAIWALLTQAQQANLLSGGGGPGGNQPWDRNRTLGLLAGLNAVMETCDEAAWPAKKDALAEAMAATAGAAGSPERANKKAMFVDFLERMWQMPAADFEGKKLELATTLEALVPQGASLASVLPLIDPQAMIRALDGSFLNPKAQGLLKELKAAREAPRP